MATTFEANTKEDTEADESECRIKTTGRYYVISLATAEPVANLKNASGNTNDNNAAHSRSRKLDSSGIPSSPVVVFPTGSGVVHVMVDKETVNLIDQRLATIFCTPNNSSILTTAIVSLIACNIQTQIPRTDDSGPPGIFKNVVIAKKGVMPFAGATGAGKFNSLAASTNH